MGTYMKYKIWDVSLSSDVNPPTFWDGLDSLYDIYHSKGINIDAGNFDQGFADLRNDFGSVGQDIYRAINDFESGGLDPADTIKVRKPGERT